MSYAIIALLDEQLQQKIQAIWQGLSENNLSHYAYEVENREPHITLASLEGVGSDIEQLCFILENALEKQESLAVDVGMIGSFFGGRIVTLNPVKSPELTVFHFNLHQKLTAYVSDASNYAPDYWVPHITLANRIDDEKIAPLYAYCLEHCEPLSGFIRKIKLIEIRDEKRVVDIAEINLN